MIEACAGTRRIRRALRRSRRLEGNQRRVWSCDRRQGADPGRRSAAGVGTRRRGGAALRRRVQPDHRRQAAGGRPRAGRAGCRGAREREFQVDGEAVRTGCTTGISVFPHNSSDAASLLANAGAALFGAKAKSRGSIGIYEPEMVRRIPGPPCAASGGLRSRSGTANCRCTTSRRPPRARRSPRAR